MPRRPRFVAREETIQSWIEPYPELMYESTRHLIYCTKCETNFGCRKSSVVRHLEGPVHNRILENDPKHFYDDLIEFLILCNIPWLQTENPAFVSFFQKYICCTCAKIPVSTVPSERTIRRHLDKFYQEKMAVINSAVKNEKLWISLDETTDFLGRYIVHFLLQPLDSSASKKTYLVACKMLEVVNGESIANFVTDCFKQLWGETYENNVQNVLLMCSDSVAYMLKAGRILKTVFPKLKHVTCLAHALHRVAERIRSQHTDVDNLIANLKNFFLKSPSRVKLLKEMYPDLPLPPKPVITRWGTWLSAVSYCVKYFNEINNVLSSLRASDAVSIKKTKNILRKPTTKRDLTYIDENYNIIELALTRLQARDTTIIDTLEIFDEVRTLINWSSNVAIQAKLEAVMERNPDLDNIRTYADKISNKSATDEDNFYIFAPLTSVEVERSFSAYKWILDVKRNRLKIENIEKIMVCYYNFIQTN